MKYVGSKNRISKELAPIIQGYITDETSGYFEPFVGGANMIDKIRCHTKLGADVHKYQIALLQRLADGWEPPKEVSEALYMDVKDHPEKYPDYLVGYIGYQLSFAGKWFAGYCRDKAGVRDYADEAYRNVTRQQEYLKDTVFICADFREHDMSRYKGFVIYCDIPYKGTTRYAQKTFPYEEFYEWARLMSKENTVLISEYQMPDDFKCIWQKATKTLISSTKEKGDKRNCRVEKLFIHENGMEVDE
jgi:site-specific DNA-adenine methylase